MEFSQEADVSNIFFKSTYAENSQIVPVQSLFLWFKAPFKKVKQKPLKKITLEIENGTYIASEDDIKNLLRLEKNV